MIVDSEKYIAVAATLDGAVLAGFEREHLARGGVVPIGAKESGFHPARERDIFEMFDEIFGKGHDQGGRA